ncbi:MAG: 4Fe-4S dicluster domain-containing protein [bacterium]|nr:4Fe-4S dicluster domain-containing protein [bacterium]
MENRFYVTSKEGIRRWLESLISRYIVYGPAKVGDDVKFIRLKNPEQTLFSYTTSILPPKKYFHPQYEVLFEYIDGKIIKNKESQQISVLFGVHPCDINSFKIIDLAMLDGEVDEEYFVRRRNMLIIGVNCLPDDSCFCNLMGSMYPPKDTDVFLTEVDDKIFVEVGSIEGEKLIELLNGLKKPDSDELNSYNMFMKCRERQFKHQLETNFEALFSKNYDANYWQELASRCLSCTACTQVCPTCFCFDVFDEVDFDGRVKRIRKWDSCQRQSFTKVASGEIFRNSRIDRVRHRFFRKFVYLKKRYGKYFCVGCGRCGRYCPVDINIPDTIKSLYAGV